MLRYCRWLMTTESQSTEFSWVRKRAECAIWPVFKKLQMDVRQDANEFMAIHPDQDDRIAVMQSDNGSRFEVYCGSDPNRTAYFSFCGDHIEITKPKERLTVTLTLDDDCKCKLLVTQGDEHVKVLDHWQLRKMVLENIFFFT